MNMSKGSKDVKRTGIEKTPFRPERRSKIRTIFSA
jgi:hypothetical protein